jgi:hypothetical protein
MHELAQERISESSTASAHRPHSTAPARAGAVRRVSGPVPPPACADALAACRSAFLTSPPQQDKRARSGTLRLYYTNKQTEGETNPEAHWRTRNRPRPRKNTAPVPGSPDPSCLPPKTTTDPAAQMTGESAQHRPRIPRRTCRTRKLQGARGTRETPKSPGFPGSPRPPPALPPPEGALRATIDSHTAPTRPARKPAPGPPTPRNSAVLTCAETAPGTPEGGTSASRARAGSRPAQAPVTGHRSAGSLALWHMGRSRHAGRSTPTASWTRIRTSG